MRKPAPPRPISSARPRGCCARLPSQAPRHARPTFRAPASSPSAPSVGVSASPTAISPPPPARISSRKTSRAGARRPDAPSSKSPQLVMLKRGAAPEPEQFQAQHREVEEAVIEPHGPVKRNEAESPLAWLARRKDRAGRAMLDPASFAAGERFRHDFTLAGLQPRVTSDWSTPVSGAALGDRGMRMTDLMVAARQRLDAALEALGPELGALVIDVCGFLQGLELVEAEHRWPARSAKVVLGIALARLAAH